MSSNVGGWLPIEPHEIILEGFDGSVKFVVDSVISDEINRRHDAIGMTTSVQVDRCDSSPKFKITTVHAMYGSLSSIYQHVHAFTTGHASQVTIEAVGFRMRIYHHQFGSRSGICVAGDVSDVLESNSFPWPEKDIGDRLLLDRQSAFHLRFGFRTSLVDPPQLKEFEDGILNLLRHLQAIGCA